MIRIFAGNADLKATFKTVALTPTMTVFDLMTLALRRFRVPNPNPNQWYISFLHGDSRKSFSYINSVIIVRDSIKSDSFAPFLPSNLQPPPLFFSFE